eukprot:TRINITY_DN8608_c0_g2_i2.p1 TRINITY_DN8608_c0_g2~~TRINITY_DN8608_c0_g2_i2.p1  ORF type:complete len:500 (-),score=61.71 TRINITY_DN8608_c0_g2_i2:431-1930(-)
MLMLALPSSVGRLDLSNNPGILDGIEDAIPSWHHAECLVKIKLVGCGVRIRQLDVLMLAGLPSMKQLDFSNNPGLLDGIEDAMASWYHVTCLIGLTLAGCGVRFRQLDTLMLAVPTSIKQLDLSDNPGILDGIEDDMPTWFQVECLMKLTLAGCGVRSRQLDMLMLGVPASLKQLDLSNNPGILDGIEDAMPSWHHAEGLVEIKLVGCGVRIRQLEMLMVAVIPLTERLDLSYNQGILDGIEEAKPAWHRVEGLVEMKLAGCGVRIRQLDMLMLAVPKLIKQLDLSNNPGILDGIEDAMPTWHHAKCLVEMNLAGCGVRSRQLDMLMFAVPKSMMRLDFSNNPGILTRIQETMLSWNHVECLEEMKLANCSVNMKQLDELMFALYTKRLELSNNLGILDGIEEDQTLSLDSWHCVECLEEVRLVGCGTTSRQLCTFVHAIAPTVSAIIVDPSVLREGAAADAFLDAGFREDEKSPGCLRRPVKPRPQSQATPNGGCVVC